MMVALPRYIPGSPESKTGTGAVPWALKTVLQGGVSIWTVKAVQYYYAWK